MLQMAPLFLQFNFEKKSTMMQFGAKQVAFANVSEPMELFDFSRRTGDKYWSPIYIFGAEVYSFT